MTKTNLPKKDKFIRDVLVNLDCIRRAKIESHFVLTKVGKQYYYCANGLSKIMIENMLKNGDFSDHLWYRDIRTSELNVLTKNAINSDEFMLINGKGRLVSGVFIASQEALTYILKKLTKIYR